MKKKLIETKKSFFDISPEISELTAVFPGDQPYCREVIMDFKKGDALVLSQIQSTVHIGAHTDAPIHYHPDGQAIHARDLHFYFGTCQVIEVTIPRKNSIFPKDIDGASILAKRILFKTRSFPNPNLWSDDFNSISSELVDHLARRGVILIGIDTPSVDSAHSKKLETHQVIYKNDLAILEGIVLDSVPEGVYTLVALPLKLRGADASPVRAILLPEGAFTDMP